MSEGLNVDQLRGARKVAVGVDLAAVAASLAANVAAAPPTVGGWLVAAVAPVGLFMAILLWHRSHGILAGWLAHGFNVGLAGIAGGAAWISYGHLRHVAETIGGQPANVSAVIPLVIDGAAALATIVVVGAGSAISEAETAAEQLQRSKAKEAADAQQRQAAVDVRRETIAVGTNPKPKKQKAAVKASREDTAAAIAAYVIDNPAATAAEVGEAIGATARTVRRYSEWTDRPAASTEVVAA